MRPWKPGRPRPMKFSSSRLMRIITGAFVFFARSAGMITGAISVIIPALLAKKTNAPVMMRISREEENFIGRGRPGFHGRMKVGFTKEGRITALDMFVICDNGPYDQVGDAASSGRIVSLLYQPLAMRWRAVTVLTNTPPRSAQSSPGGMQGIAIMEPLLAK